MLEHVYSLPISMYEYLTISLFSTVKHSVVYYDVIRIVYY